MSRRDGSGKPNFLYYTDWAEQLLTFPDDLRLKIDDAVKRYVLYGEEPTDREVIYSMFGLMREQIDRDRAKYRNTCQKNAENARIRWGCDRMQSNATAYDRMRANAVDADNDNDNDDDNDKIKKLPIGSKESAAKPRPAPETIKDYFLTIGGTDTDAKSFYDYYTANGWRTGKNAIKDWRAAARNWMNRKPEFNKPAKTTDHETTRKYNFL